MVHRILYGGLLLIGAVVLSVGFTIILLRDYKKADAVSAFTMGAYNDEYFSQCSSTALDTVQQFNNIYKFTESDSLSDKDFFFSATGNTVVDLALEQKVSDVLGSTWVTTKSYLAGDFVAEVDLKSFKADVKTAEKSAIFFLKGIAKDFSFFNLVLNKDVRGTYFTLGGVSNVTGADPYIGTEPIFVDSVENAKLKIMRVGAIFKAFVDLGDGAGYVELWNKPYYVTTSALSIGFGNQNFSLNPQEIISNVESFKIIGCEKL